MRVARSIVNAIGRQLAFEKPDLRLRHLLERFRQDQSGAYVIIAAIAMPALVGFAGLGTEIGLWYYQHRKMQSAADSGAYSAAIAYGVSNKNNLTDQAKSVASTYGFVNGTSGVTIAVNRPPKSGPNTANLGAVEVIIQQPYPRLFSALWQKESVNIKSRAVAIGNNAGIGCVLALNPTASGAAVSQGGTKVNLKGCSLYDNSGNASALTVGGSASLTAQSVHVVGGISGSSNIKATDGVYSGASPLQDPFADVKMPTFTGCDKKNFSSHKTETINPGVYCGGMKFNAGANVTLNPGVYIIDGGGLDVSGGATLSGSGVTFVFTSSSGKDWATATINGGATLNLSAPTTGPFAGILMFGDRNMPLDTTFKFNGGSTQNLNGAIYFQKGTVNYSGGADANNGCTKIVADKISFDGNANLAVNCAGTGIKSFGTATATLVE